MKIGWSELNNVQQAGQYPFRDGVITVLELEIAIWRKHPNALFTLMRKNPISDRVEYVLGKHECNTSAFYSFGMPGTDYMLELTDPMGFNKNPALGGVSGKLSSLFTFASGPTSTTSTPGTTAQRKAN
jgi:hypothetical protein